MSTLHIGLAGPVALQQISPWLDGARPVSDGYSAPVISRLALALLERGHHLTIFTLSPVSADHGDFSGDRLTVIVRPYRLRLRWADAFRAERRALTAAMQASECDVIHANWAYEFALAALRSGKPTVVTLHDWAPEILRYQRHPYRAVRLGMQWAALRRSKFLTANSPYIAEHAQRWVHRDVPVVPNGIDMSSSPPSRPASSGFVIGALNSGFGQRKNVTTLLEAFATVRAKLPDARLRLAGPDFGPDEPAYGWAADRRLHHGVEFVGRLPPPEVPGFMRSLDLFVHPSLEESFGMVLLEALVEGTPVVAGARSGAVPWVLGNGTAGTLVDVTSPSALSSEIIRLLGDNVALRASAASGFVHVRENFSLEHVVDLYEAQYRQVLDDRGIVPERAPGLGRARSHRFTRKNTPSH